MTLKTASTKHSSMAAAGSGKHIREAAPNNRYFDPAIRHNKTFVILMSYWCKSLMIAE